MGEAMKDPRFQPGRSEAGVSRRDVIKWAGTLTGMAALAGAGLLQTASGAAAVTQDSWHFCSDCKGMYYPSFTSDGICPVVRPYGPHEESTSYNYYFENTGDGQAGWRWCNKCRMMFYGGSTAKGGVCPADSKAHDGTHSYDYHVWWTGDHPSVGEMQTGWHWCTSCAALVWQTVSQYPSECPATNDYHTRGSRVYVVGYLEY